MPDLQLIQQGVIRYGNYALVGGYLSVVPKRVLFARAVNMATIGDQLTAITYDDPDGGAGVYTDVPEDAEIVVYDGANPTVKGRLRVAYGGASSSIIQVNEVSKGRLQIADNDRFEVWDEFRLHDKLVGATDTFPKDSRREYVDEGEEPAPAIIVGGAAVGWLDPITGVLEVEFDASGSYPTDTDNTGGLTYLWDVADGAITVGVDTDDSITVEFDTTTTHFRHVTLTVTDADTGKATVRKIPVWSHDADNLPVAVTKADYGFDRTRGDWSATFALDSTGVDIDSLRDGCFVVYWEVERYDGGTAPGEISYGNEFAGRSNVRFAGYLRRETITINPDNDTLTIEAISPLAKLAELAGFSQVLDTTTNPETWQQDERVTINKLLWYVAHYHSTLSVCHDLVVPDTDYDFPDFAIQQATLKDQLIEVANGVSCTVLCDATGRIIVKRSLQRATVGERNSAGVALDIIAQDLREVPNLVYEHAYQYNSVLLKMFTTAGNPILSIAPGEAPAEAPDRSTFERAIGVDQNEANAIAGFVFAELNSLYNGKPVPKGMTLKPHSGYGVLDPAYPMWVQVTLAATTNKRGRALSGDKFIPAKVDISTDPESGLKDISWTLDHETYGYPGVTRAVEVSNELPPITYPNPTPAPSPYNPDLLTRAAGTIYAFATDNYLYRIGSFQTPSYQRDTSMVTRQAVGNSGNIIDAVQDAFTRTKAIVVTDHTDAIYTVEGIGGSLTVTLRKTLRAAISNQALQWRMVDASFGADYIVVVSYYGNSGADSGTWYTYSTNGGVSWSTESQITAHYSSTAGANIPGLFMSSRSPGEALIGVFTASGATTSADASLYRLSGTFGSPAAYQVLNDAPAYCIHKSWADSEQTLYYSTVNFSDGASTRNRIYRKIGSGSAVEITPTIGGNKQRAIYGRGFHTCPLDANRVVAAVAGNTTSGVVVSPNKGTTWTQITTGSTTSYNCAELVDSTAFYVWGNGGRVGISLDFGADGIDERGVAVAYPSAGRIVRIMGGSS